MFLGSKLGYLGDHDSKIYPNISTEKFFELLYKPVVQLAPSHIYTGLFPGSEQAIAMIAEDLEIPYTVLMAFKREHYSGRWTHDDRERYVVLRDNAETRIYAEPDRHPAARQKLSESVMTDLKLRCITHLLESSDYVATNIVSVERSSYLLKALKTGKSIINFSSYVS